MNKITIVALGLLALPLAVWLDLTNLAEAALRRQATDLNSVITSVRGYQKQAPCCRPLSCDGRSLRDLSVAGSQAVAVHDLAIH